MDHPETPFTIIRGTFDCPWCDKAKTMLKEKGLPTTVRQLGMAELILQQAEIGHRTVPIIFHGVRFIGGYTELEAYLTES